MTDLATTIHRKVKKRKKEIFLFVLIVSIVLCVEIFFNSCLGVVEEVNSELLRLGLNKTCAKLKIHSQQDCDEFESRNRNQDFETDFQNCEMFIEKTKVNYHEEEKQYPMAFSILAHRDLVHLTK